MSDELDRLATEQGIELVQSLDELSAEELMTDEEFAQYMAAIRECRGEP